MMSTCRDQFLTQFQIRSTSYVLIIMIRVGSLIPSTFYDTDVPVSRCDRNVNWCNEDVSLHHRLWLL